MAGNEPEQRTGATRKESLVNRILVPLDGSRLSEAALPLADALARDYEAEILLVRALQARPTAEAEVEAEKEAAAYLAMTTDRLRGRGLPAVAWKVWYDEPEQAIADAARYNAADLVVMSTHGRGGLSRLLMGSVAESVVRRTTVPVLLVRGEVPPPPSGLARILVPLDGSELAEAVLPLVTRLAGPFDFVIELIRAVEPLPAAALAEVSLHVQDLTTVRVTEAERYLEKIAAGLEARGLRVRAAVRVGMPVDVILHHGREAGAGLVAMSTHGRSGLGRLLLGSVAERVVRNADVPVLLWKGPTPAAG
jgi:nucleotide-binding universal stress UspA family protein